MLILSFSHNMLFSVQFGVGVQMGLLYDYVLDACARPVCMHSYGSLMFNSHLLHN